MARPSIQGFHFSHVRRLCGATSYKTQADGIFQFVCVWILPFKLYSLSGGYQWSMMKQGMSTSIAWSKDGTCTWPSLLSIPLSFYPIPCLQWFEVPELSYFARPPAPGNFFATGLAKLTSSDYHPLTLEGSAHPSPRTRKRLSAPIEKHLVLQPSVHLLPAPHRTQREK